MLTKDGNRLKYVSTDGTELKMYRKEWERNEQGGLDKIMLEFNDAPVVQSNVDPDTGEILEHE
jgi:hypothetical protein